MHKVEIEVVNTILDTDTEQRPEPSRLSLWLLRLLMGLLLLFGSEILLWTTPLDRPVLDWLLLAAGNLALGALLLDLAARYRIRDIYDAMALTAVYGLLTALLLNPQLALEDFPRTLVTRVLGGYTLLGFEMFGLFLVLTGGHILRYRRLLLGVAAWLGFYWGVWVHWFPLLTGRVTEPVDLSVMLALAAGFMIVIVVAWFVAMRRSNNILPPDLRLSSMELILVFVVLGGLGAWRFSQGALDVMPLVWMAILMVVCLAVLWFRRRDRGRELLDEHIPPHPLNPIWIVAAAILFGLATVFAYHLPLLDLDGFNQLALMEFGFAAVGFFWLPLIAGVISVRAIDRQSRTGRIE